MVEIPYKSHTGLPQYHKCQAYGHTKTYYSHKPHCVKYSEEHLSNYCPKDSRIPAKYAIHAEAHTSSYKICPVYKTHAASFKIQTTGKLYPSVLKSTKNMQSENHCNSNNQRTYADIATNQQSTVSNNLNSTISIP